MFLGEISLSFQSSSCKKHMHELVCQNWRRPSTPWIRMLNVFCMYAMRVIELLIHFCAQSTTTWIILSQKKTHELCTLGKMHGHEKLSVILDHHVSSWHGGPHQLLSSTCTAAAQIQSRWRPHELTQQAYWTPEQINMHACMHASFSIRFCGFSIRWSWVQEFLYKIHACLCSCNSTAKKLRDG